MTWDLRPLGEMCAKIVKSDPKNTGRSKIRYIDIGSVDGIRHRLGDVPEIDAGTAPSRCRQIVMSGDTIFSTVRPYLEKIAYIGDDLDGEFSSTGFCVLRPNGEVDPRFLFFFSISPVMLGQIFPLQKGVSYPAVLDKEVRSVLMPVPPLGEQRRIAAILEEYLSRLDSADALLDEVDARVSGLSEKLFSDRINEIPFDTMRLGELLIGRLANGKSVPTADTGFPVLRLTALDDGKIDLSQRKIGAWNKEEAERFLVAKNDFLISRGNGSLNLVGRGGVVGEVRHDVAYPDTLIRARLNSDLVDLDFFSLVFNSKFIRSQIESMAKTTAGIYKINQKDLGSLVVPTPSVDDQRNIAADVSAQREKLTSAQGMVATGRKRSTALRRSLLHAAFTGRLTEQSASEMVAGA